MRYSFWQRVDVTVVAIALLLSLLGVCAIQSAFSSSWTPLAPEALKQGGFIVAGFVLMTIMAFIDYEDLGRFAVPIAAVNIALLLAVLFLGHSANGAQRWVSLGPLGRFQPSEPAKLAVIIALAKILSHVRKLERKDIVSVVFTVAVPWFLIFLQPDLGTSLVLVFVGFVMLYVAGVNPLILGGIVVAGMAAAPFALHDYQKQRLFIFMNPEADASGAGWNITQSKIAIGNGGLWGQGLFRGTQTQMDFVPEHGTDFIFSVIGEEMGFVVCIVLVVFYMIFIARCLRIAMLSKDRFGMLAASGIFALFLFHIFINIGMTMGIMPVVGVPLSFVSYGGSSLLTNFIAAGILCSIFSRRGRLFMP